MKKFQLPTLSGGCSNTLLYRENICLEFCSSEEQRDEESRKSINMSWPGDGGDDHFGPMHVISALALLQLMRKAPLIRWKRLHRCDCLIANNMDSQFPDTISSHFRIVLYQVQHVTKGSSFPKQRVTFSAKSYLIEQRIPNLVWLSLVHSLYII